MDEEGGDGINGFAYSYDAVGHYRMPGYLSLERVGALIEDLDRVGWGDSDFGRTRRIEELINHSEVARALAEEIFAADWLSATMTYPHRMIESYALDRGQNGWLPFHGGAVERLGRGGYPAAEDISTTYFVRAERMYSMRVKALVYLDPIEDDEDGPLLYVEGSHKANFPFMQAFATGPRTLEGYDHLVRRIAVGAGDLVLLNEAVVHGTRAKTTPARRRLAIFTFAPSFVREWADLERDDTNLRRSGYGMVDTEDGH